MTKRVLGWVVGTAALMLWWFYAIDWLIVPGTYRTATAYLCVVLVSSCFHVHAFARFVKMTRRIRRAEMLGAVEPGSTLFAANQRFRYFTRLCEATVMMTVGILGLVSVHHPGVSYNPSYVRLILTYLIGTIAVTGYLTYRDLKVLNVVRGMGQSSVDRAVLEPKDMV